MTARDIHSFAQLVFELTLKKVDEVPYYATTELMESLGLMSDGLECSVHRFHTTYGVIALIYNPEEDGVREA